MQAGLIPGTSDWPKIGERQPTQRKKTQSILREIGSDTLAAATVTCAIYRAYRQLFPEDACSRLPRLCYDPDVGVTTAQSGSAQAAGKRCGARGAPRPALLFGKVTTSGMLRRALALPSMGSYMRSYSATTSSRAGSSHNYIFLGAPGVGKGTFASRVAKKLNIPAISTGDIIRAEIKKDSEVGRLVKSYSDTGRLVPDEVVTKMVRDRLQESDTKKGYILVRSNAPRSIVWWGRQCSHLSL